MRFSNLISLLMFVLLISSCDAALLDVDRDKDKDGDIGVDVISKYQDINVCYSEDSCYFHDKPDNEGVVNALKKAKMMAYVQWIPLSQIFSSYSTPYVAGQSLRGIPYSLTNMTNSYVGLNISIYTFLTSINNPRSIMYKGNSIKIPYYGSVCTSSVEYVLGVPAFYYARNFGKISGMKRMKYLNADSVDSLRLCDVLQTQDHVSMVFDICRDSSGMARAIYIFETTRTDAADTHIVRYTRDSFQEKWKRLGWSAYRYDKLNSNIIPEYDQYYIDNPIIKLNICTSKGDRVTYFEGEPVTINIFNSGTSFIRIYKNDVLYSTVPVSGPEMTINGLSYGSYKVCLSNSQDSPSGSTYFEVLNVSYSVNNGQVVFSSSNSEPVYAQLCDERDSPGVVYIFNDIQKRDGTVDVRDNTYKYCKLFFKGKYGVSALPKILVE